MKAPGLGGEPAVDPRSPLEREASVRRDVLPEFWLRGPVEGISPFLMPVAHALLQSRADVREAAGELPPDELWDRPGGAAAIGFHLLHIRGSLDRLVAYSRGQSLDTQQLAAAREEGSAGAPPATARALLALVDASVENALRRLAEVSKPTFSAHEWLAAPDSPAMCWVCSSTRRSTPNATPARSSRRARSSAGSDPSPAERESQAIPAASRTRGGTHGWHEPAPRLTQRGSPSMCCSLARRTRR